MKTESTEALRAMANDLKYNTGLIHSNIQLLIEESFISGVKYGQSNPKIKQLEWENSIIEVDGSEWIESHYIFGQFYEIKNCSNHYFILYMVDGTETTHLSLNEAKVAAQADFEKRVKNFLVT